jgi:hypothetical protein
VNHLEKTRNSPQAVKAGLFATNLPLEQATEVAVRSSSLLVRRGRGSYERCCGYGQEPDPANPTKDGALRQIESIAVDLPPRETNVGSRGGKPRSSMQCTVAP